MKVLVTGGTGFVGSLTAKALIDAGHSVRLLVRSEQKAKEVFTKLGVAEQLSDIVIGDIIDPASVEKAVSGCDAVVHSAAMVSTAEKDADIVYKTNVGGTKTVIESSLAEGVKKIIYVSSVSALFNPDDEVMNEQSAVCEGKNPYGRSKIACEHYVRDLQQQGKPIVITYPSGVVGEFDPALSEPHFGIKLFVSQFTFTSSTGMQFVNARDIARAHLAILEHVEGADRFILGGSYYSWQDLLSITRKVTGRKLPSIHIPGNVLRFFGSCADVVIKLTGMQFPFTGEGMTYATQWIYADSSKLQEELGITFADKEETLAEVIRWLYINGDISKAKAGKLGY